MIFLKLQRNWNCRVRKNQLWPICTSLADEGLFPANNWLSYLGCGTYHIIHTDGDRVRIQHYYHTYCNELLVGPCIRSYKMSTSLWLNADRTLRLDIELRKRHGSPNSFCPYLILSGGGTGIWIFNGVALSLVVFKYWAPNQGRIKHVGGPGPTWERGPLLQLSLLHKIPHISSLG